MPKGIRKDYSKELKLTAVYLMQNKVLPPKEIFALLGGLDRQTVYRWVHEYEEHGEAAFDEKRAVLPSSELRRLRKEAADLQMENEILKKATTYFAKKEDYRVDFAAEKLRAYPQRKVCQVLRISVSTLYYRRSHPKQAGYTEDEKEKVINLFYYHMGNFGRRPLHRELDRAGEHISEHKISKILKDSGLSSKYGRRKCRNIHSNQEVSEKYIAENLYPQLSGEDKKKEIWSMDFTEQKVDGKKVITCGIVSVNSKRLVARVSGCRNNAEAACQTLALGIRSFGAPYMLMTDRGSPFVSRKFHECLKTERIVHSMSRPHTPIDNRFIETFWKSMKTEIGKVRELTVELYLMILDYYEYYYNYLRPHSSLGYCPPMTQHLPAVI